MLPWRLHLFSLLLRLLFGILLLLFPSLATSYVWPLNNPFSLKCSPPFTLNCKNKFGGTYRVLFPNIFLCLPLYRTLSAGRCLMRFGRTARCISLIILHHRRKFEAVVRRENGEKERMLNYVHSKNFMILGSWPLVKVN